MANIFDKNGQLARVAPGELISAELLNAIIDRLNALGDPALIKLGGDVRGTAADSSVAALQGVPLKGKGPQEGDVLAFAGGAWQPLAAARGAVVAAGMIRASEKGLSCEALLGNMKCTEAEEDMLAVSFKGYNAAEYEYFVRTQVVGPVMPGLLAVRVVQIGAKAILIAVADDAREQPQKLAEGSGKLAVNVKKGDVALYVEVAAYPQAGREDFRTLREDLAITGEASAMAVLVKKMDEDRQRTEAMMALIEKLQGSDKAEVAVAVAPVTAPKAAPAPSKARKPSGKRSPA